MLLLALDTSTPAVTVALRDADHVVAEATTVDPRRHTELLMPQVTQVLRDAGVARRDLTAIAVGIGPGPFTGLRVGVAAARMMGAVLDVPVRGVCSLDIIAREVLTETAPTMPFLVATDARRREVYWAAYDASGTRTEGPDVAAATDVAAAHEAMPVAGAGATLYPDAFAARIAPQYPSAAYLADAVATGAAQVVAPDPLYLRRPDAAPPAARKSVLT